MTEPTPKHDEAPRDPPTRRVGLLWLPIVFSLLGVVFLLAAPRFLEAWANAPLANRAAVTFDVESGSTFDRFARQLEALDVLDSAWLYTLRANDLGVARKIQVGEYEVVVGETPDSLLAKVINGDVIAHAVTFIEGSTIADVLDQLAGDERLIFDLTGADELMVRLGLDDEQGPEGRFFPDTYYFHGGATASSLLRRAHERMQTLLASAWNERAENLPYSSPYESLILASIIEKETGHPDDRARIAGVFTRRLAAKMRLQSDPTVIYGLGASFDGDLTRAQLEAVTSFNTYRILGLPPTPIALPGKDSIQAALHPAAGSSLYFVARGDGTSQFSDTLEEHNRAVARYQLGR